MTPVTKRRWSLSTCLAGCALALAVNATCAQEHHQHDRYHIQPSFYDFQVMARSAVFGPFLQQARNGHVLDQALWNYHYAEGNDELLSNGHYLLDRLARRAQGGMLELQLQTARDLAYRRENKLKYQKVRSELDYKRVQAIVDYMQAFHPDITFTVRVIDPAPVGMNGLEAVRAFREVNNSAKGVLPRELLGGLGNYLRTDGAGGGDIPAADTSATAGTSTDSATLGVDAAAQSASDLPPITAP